MDRFKNHPLFKNLKSHFYNHTPREVGMPKYREYVNVDGRDLNMFKALRTSEEFSFANGKEALTWGLITRRDL